MSAAPIQPEFLELEGLLSKVRELAVLPHVVYKVLEISGASDTSTAEIERAIVVDPGFSSKLLTVANSAYYALPRKVTSIKEAILFLGFKSVRQIAMTVGIYDMFIGKTDRESLRRRAWWRHSVDTAVCCKWLAKKSGKLAPEDAYTSGLLHLIGKTLLDRFGGRDYEAVEILVQNGFPGVHAEQKVYGYDHIVVATAAARKWGFPGQLIAGLQHLEPPAPEDPDAPIRACVAISTKIAQWAVDGAVEDDGAEEQTLPAWALSILGIEAGKHDDTVHGGAAAISEASTVQA